jgi:hypothetical protein
MPATTVDEAVRRTSESTRPPRDTRSRLATAAGALPGAAIAVGLGAVAALRRAKPVHPVGRVGAGELEVTSPRPEFRVPLLATRDTHRCTVRFSRTIGLPAPLPDVEGLAVRLEEPMADLLFASTGTGTLTRFVLEVRRPDQHGAQTTFLPVATDSGALLLRMTPLDQSDPPLMWELSAAHVGAEWKPVGVLRVAWGTDKPMRFDPVENVLPGTRQYPLVRVLREPSYLLARRAVRVPRT